MFKKLLPLVVVSIFIILVIISFKEEFTNIQIPHVGGEIVVENPTEKREVEILPATPRGKGEETSSPIPAIKDHDFMEVSVARDPAWNIDNKTSAVVVIDMLSDGKWTEFASFTVANEPSVDVPIGIEPPEPLTHSGIKLPLHPNYREKEFRVRLKTEKPSAVDVKFITSFEGVVFQPGKLPNSVAFDAASSVEGFGVTSVSWTHTPSGTPTGVAVSGGGATGVTSATYAGTATTLVGAANGSFQHSEMYDLGNPTSGAQTVVVNFSPSSYYAIGSAVTVVGGDTSDVMDGVQTGVDNSFGSSSSSLSVTSSVGDLVLDAISVYPSTGGPSVGAGQTQRWANTGTNPQFHGSTETGASSVTMSWSGWTGGAFSHVAANFRQAAPPATGGFTRENIIWFE